MQKILSYVDYKNYIKIVLKFSKFLIKSIFTRTYILIFKNYLLASEVKIMLFKYISVTNNKFHKIERIRIVRKKYLQ